MKIIFRWKKGFITLFAVVFMTFFMLATPVSATETENTTQDVVDNVLTFSEDKDISDVSDASFLEAIDAEYDVSTNTLIFQSDLVLEKPLYMFPKKTLTIDVNGHSVSGSSLYIENTKKAPVTIVGGGTFDNCTITKYGVGKLTLDGDITYNNTDNYGLFLREGQTVIKNGEFVSSNQYSIWADYSYEGEKSYLYIKGGNFYGDILVSNTETTIYKGTIDGIVKVYGSNLVVKGGTLKKGIVTELGSEDETCKVKISGGKILDQILLNEGYGSVLEISGGTIQSAKEAVIQSCVLASENYSHGDITITGGKIVSTCKNGYGIQATNSEIKFKGGSITNTTKKGNIGIYSIRYTSNRKDVSISKKNQALIKGFSTAVKNEYRKDYCGENVRFKLDDKGTLTIYGTGDMMSSIYFSNIDNGKYKNKIKKVVVKEGVTSVGGFSGCDKLEAVSLSSSVKEIYMNAFYECTSLKKVVLKDGLEKIGHYAFMYNTNLREINIPDTVTEIGSQCFYSCVKMKKAQLSDCLTLLADNIFANCSSLKEINIPEGITTIGYGAFYKCKKLTSVKLPSTLESIGATAFIHCISLTELEIPSGVTEIRRSAFKGCKKLATVKMELSEAAKVDKTAFADTPYKANLY